MSLLGKIRAFVRSHRRELLISGAALLLGFVVVQLLYPTSKLLPFATIDGVEVGSQPKAEAVSVLDTNYKNHDVSLYFGDHKDAYASAKPAEIGLAVNNQQRVQAANYPWYMRLVPTSVLWYGAVQTIEAPKYQRDQTKLNDFMKQKLGDSCNIKPVNASLKADNDRLVVVPAKDGGTCKLDDVRSALADVQPMLTEPTNVRVALTTIPPEISDNQAKTLGDTLNQQLNGGVTLSAGGNSVTFAAKNVAAWLTFSVSKKQLTVNLKTAKAYPELTKKLKPKVAVAAGVSKVKTRDFVEVSRQNGAAGKTLNAKATGEEVIDYLTGKKPKPAAITKAVAPSVEYTRSYSPTDTGLSALLKQYADDHDGTYGAQLIELSGARRRASYNADKQFITASTYKLFVAYSSLKRVEAGDWHWSDQINGGRDLAACFDDMIVKSDNDCAKALLEKIGFQSITNEAHALGCNSTTFLDKEGIKSTPGDLALFLAELKSGQLLKKQSSRDRLMSAMKRNIYRQGIPAGVSATVGDKVGFLDNLLHDAAIVYSPHGTYVLVIMTKDSSWANIAELAKKVDSLRSK